jgi:transposase InsO family protein
VPHGVLCLFLVRRFLRLAIAIDDHHRRVARRVKRWQKRVRTLYERWLRWRGLLAPKPFRRRHHPWNKTPDDVEEQIVRLHVQQPRLGAGQLRFLAARVLGFSAARETIRQILIRRRDLVAALEDERRKKPRRIDIAAPRQLRGMDLTLVWLLGIVDYHGSRLVTLERMAGWPTAARVATALERAVARHGAPARLLTDRAPVFRAAEVGRVLAEHRTRHALIRPCHAWTGGRIERLFRTFKETVFRDCGLWLFASAAQIDRYCTDFLLFYNRDRSHSSYGGRTPDEVYFDRAPRRAVARVDYFDGRLRWWRFT